MYTENKKKIREYFYSQSDEWRIEAVIHDGNWYDFKKWKKVAKVKKDVLEKWIAENKDKLIISELGSYRVGYDEIIRWYNENDLDLEESIVPNNFPPKLWDKTTETDVFLSAPRRRVGTVSFVAETKEILEKCENILKGTAKIMPDDGGRYKAHGLSAVHIKNLLSKGLTKEEFDSLQIKTRAMVMQRELIDLPPLWLEEALDFYANTFAPSALRSSMSTISIYLPDRHDIHSQTMIWVISAMKKFDENASVPFSGYLSNVLRHWPYDLPDEHLGKELSKFQRDRKKAIEQAEREGLSVDGNVPIEVIAEIMGITLEEYIELNNEHENWLAEKNATTLTWEDSANEKKGKLVGETESIKNDAQELSRMSIATVKAAVDTEDWDSAYKLISQIDSNEIDDEIGKKLSEDFVKQFAAYLKELSEE